MFFKRKPAFTMRSKEFGTKKGIERYQQDVPGPGSYESTFHKKNNSIGFSRASRDTMSSKSKFQTPGPGSYNLPSKVAEVPTYENLPKIKKTN